MDIDKYEERKQKKMEGKYKGCATSFIAFIIIMIILWAFYGCTTVRYVPVVEHSTDTVQITKQQRDSIWLHDSIYMHEYQHGDTTYILRDRWHTKYIESISHDTTYISKRDTIPCPYPVEVEVEKKLTWWQRFRISMASVIIWFLLIWGIALGLKTYWKRFLP